MNEVPLGVPYIGGDIVGDVVAENQRRYGSDRRSFIRVDIVTDALPQAHVVLCRDCLPHLSNADVLRALRNVRSSGASYLLTTTFDERRRNIDVITGFWRPLNLELPPFSLPKPIACIDEQCPDPAYRDKKLALWRTSDLP
jgi:hypothetical protein